MHVVKNVFDTIFGTIMGIRGKTKDGWKCRKDLMEIGIRPELHLICKGDSFETPMACYNLTLDEKKKVCEFLLSIKYPDGFASNISRCIKMGECHITGFKSHDCHIFLQRVLPLAIRGCLTAEVRQVLFELSDFFKKLCSRTLNSNVLEEQEKSIVLILCKLERIFPPSIFDIMVHLMLHLPSEAKIAGPAQYRWMFPFERKMSTLKSYVNNKARPEGSIAERYIDSECLTFTSMYLHTVETSFNRPERNYDGGESSGQLSVFSCNGRPFGGPIHHCFDDLELAKVHNYVLNNCDEIEDFIYEHKQKLRLENSGNVDRRHDKEFPKWFADRVLYGQDECINELRSLAMGPDNRVKRYAGCNINGFRFHTKDREQDKRTQNSGIMVKGEHGANSINFYGVIQDVLEVEYLLGRKKVVLFKCQWWNVGDNAGMQVDKEWKMTSVNVSRKWYQNQPYVLASQAEQVFYIQDMKLGKNWYVVESFKPRSCYDVPEQEGEEDIPEAFQEDEPNEVLTIGEIGEISYLAGATMEPLECTPTDCILEKRSKYYKERRVDDFINDDDLEEEVANDGSDEEEILVDDGF